MEISPQKGALSEVRETAKRRQRDRRDAMEKRNTSMFAVLKTGGKQYKVANGDVLKVEKLAGGAGDKVQFNEILMLGGETVTIGAPLVADAGVQAEILDQIRGPKLIHYVKRRRKHSSQRKKGHRQSLTVLRVTEILAKGAAKSGVAAAIGGVAVLADTSPMAKKSAARKAEAKAEAKPAEKPAAKAKATKAVAGDDLKVLSGVGPALEKRLHDAGVTTFAQIAAWTADDITAMDEKLDFKGRIEREGWVEQAKELVKG